MQLNELAKFRNLFITVTWLSFFLSINLNPIEFFSFNYINKIRILSPLIFSLIFFFYSLPILSKKIYLDYLIFYVFCFLYILFNLINLDNSNLNTFWPVYMIIGLIFLNCLNYQEKIYVSKITIFILLLGFLFYFYLGLSHMIDKKVYHFYGIMGSDGYSFIDNPPRSSGLARLALILFSASTLYLLCKKKINTKNYTLLFLISFLGLCTLIFQSRTVTFIFIIINIIFIFLYFKVFLKNKKILVFTFIIPITMNAFYFTSNSYLNGDKFFDEIQNDYRLSGPVVTNLFKSSLLRKQDSENYSSGRFDNWKKTFEIIKSDFFIGYGAQADRLYINQSIHNAILYSYLAGGFLAFLCMIFIYLRTLFFLIKYINQERKYFNFHISFCISAIIIINLRSILETSFAVFSIDYLIFIVAYFVMHESLIKNKEN